MKLSPRVIVPVAAALLLSLAIGMVFLWQIRASIGTIESSFQGHNGATNLLKRMLPSRKTGVRDSATKSQSLLELRQGEILELKGEWKQAEMHYAKSVESGGGAPALKKLAAIQLQRREYAPAKETIAQLREGSGENADVLLLEGLLALRNGDAGGAATIFKRQPNAPQSHYGLGLVAISKGDHESAQKELTLAAQGSDSVIRAYAKTILAAYSEFSLFPNGQDIHLQTLVARALAQVSECETALPLLNDVVVQEEKYRDAWIVKGYCEFTTERTKDALTSLEQAYALDPEKAEIQYFLARTHEALGDPQNAVTFLQYAILNGFAPEGDARELLADYALELGNTPLALEQYKILAEKKDSDSSSYERYVNLAAVSAATAPDALTVAKEALVRWPDDPSVLAMTAKAALTAGLPDDATRYIQTALRIDPKNAKALAVQGMLNKAVGIPRK